MVIVVETYHDDETLMQNAKTYMTESRNCSRKVHVYSTIAVQV